MTVTNSTFTDNYGWVGGGIENLGGTATLTNCTFFRNASAYSGGAVYTSHGGSTTLTNCTIANNLGNSAGSIDTSADGVSITKLRNSIVAGGLNGNFANASLVSLGYNVSDDNTGAALLTAPGDLNDTDLLLDPDGPASNGGPTQTIALRTGSPAIDRVPASGADCPAADQRGTVRPQPAGGACDSGAYEIAWISTSLTVDPASGVFGGTTNLRAVLTEASGGAALTGFTVAFTLNGAAACGVAGQPDCPTTDASGVAQVTGVSLESIAPGVRPSGVGASFAGGGGAFASSASAQLNVSPAGTAVSGIVVVPASVSYGITAVTLSANVSNTSNDAALTGGTLTFQVTNATNTATYCSTAPTAVGGSDPVSISDILCTFTTLPPPGTVTIRASYSGDANFLGSSGTQNIDIAPDNTPPSISLPANMTLEATGPGGAPASFAPSATDLNPPSPDVTCTRASGSIFTIGTTIVTCSATDAVGNTGSGSFTVTVQDTTPPVISGTPDEQTVEATGPGGATVAFTAPTASDLVDGVRPMNCDYPTSGFTFPIGATTINCATSDSRGNSASTTFSVTVVDTTPPELSGTPDALTIEATGSAGAVGSYTLPAASDAVDGSRSVSCSVIPGSTVALGTTTVTCSASDTRGNSASISFTVTVQDTTAPAITVPAGITADATGPAGARLTFSATATDLVNGSRPVSCVPTSGSTFAAGATQVTCTATDGAGNVGSASFVVTVTGSVELLGQLRADTVALVGNASTERTLIATIDRAQQQLNSGAIFSVYASILKLVLQLDAAEDAGRISAATARQLAAQARLVLDAIL